MTNACKTGEKSNGGRDLSGQQRRLPERVVVITKIQRRHPGKTLGEECSRKEAGNYKGPEAEMTLACLRITTKAKMAVQGKG